MSKGTIHATLNGERGFKGFAYFFNHHQYWKYDWKKDGVVEGYPMSIDLWKLPPPFSQGIDAALEGHGKYAGKAYFFKGDEYIRYDWDKDAVDAGYPRKLAAWNLPPAFASGVDAVLNGKGAYAGKAYFFKRDQYVRYDWATDRADKGYPQPIAAWNLPAPFNQGIDAALNGQEAFEGKAYFFKGNQYIRYDWATDKPDNNGAKSISAWGIPENGSNQHPASVLTDAEGNRFLKGGTWNGNSNLNVKGGQVMHFEISNLNVLGTTITITSNLGGKKSLIIPPMMTLSMVFDCFGSEPMGWNFSIETNSDAFIVAWKLYSSWVTGDPPNP